MTSDDYETSDPQDQTPSPAEEAETDDGCAPDEPFEEQVLEDEPELLDSTARALDGEPAAPDERKGAPPDLPTRDVDETQEREDAGDTDAIPDEPGADEESLSPREWAEEVSPRRVVVELKRVEKQVRELLEGRDSKRKRKLTGTRRWCELEEDIISWSYSGRFDEEMLATLRQLIVRRHHLFGRLRFLAGTRATWNT